MRFRKLRGLLFVGAMSAGLVAGSAGCDGNGQPNPTSTQWVRQLGTSADDTLYAVAGSGSMLYAAGSTNGRFPDVVGTSAPPDGLLVKFDPAGQVAWKRQYGTTDLDAWRSVAVDAAGNAYVVGFTAGLFDGQTRAGGGSDAVIARIRPDGSLDWVRQFGTTDADYLLAVVTDSLGNAYAAGWTAGAFPTQTRNGPSDGFVVKYRADGTQEWLTQFGCAKEDSLSAIAIDASGALYVAGWAADAVAAGQQPLGARDAALYKVQPGVGVIWARQFGSSEDDEAAAIGVFGSNIYASGRTFGTLPGQAASGRLDGFAASYDLSGKERWLRQIGTAGDDELHALAVAADGSGVYVGGYVGRSFLSAKWLGLADAFFVKMQSDGRQDFANQFGTASDDKVLGLYTSGPGALFAVGATGDALPANQPAGASDAFIASYTVP